ncbi:MAG: acyl carrier protein [Thermodesulforhabdaceae bacterium]|jgi:acyl carrier protein
MDKAAIKEKVIDIIADKLGIERETITPEAHVIDDLGADSLDVVEMIMALEEAFDIEIPDEDAEKIRTVQDIFDYIDRVAANAA